MPTVGLWTGREARALRLARRMSVREFAAHLGVAARMVSKWEAGGEYIRPRPLNQAALDTSLNIAADTVQRRYDQITGNPGHGGAARVAGLLDGAMCLIRHPVDGKVMTMIEAGPVRGNQEHRWLTSYFIDVDLVSHDEYARFAAVTGHPPALADQWAPSGSDPAVGISWSDAVAYARWASKEVPDATQWDKAAAGPGGMNVDSVPEWCQVLGQPVKRGHRTSRKCAFRCAAPAAAVLALLAV